MNGNSALPRLDAEVFGRLRLCSTATLTTQLFARGLRNTFLGGLVTLDTASARLVGEAFTLRYIPAREDLDVLDVYLARRRRDRVARAG